MRKPALERRAEILAAAAVEFAETGLAGTRLEAIAGRVGISHPRIVQMFGSKQMLFLGVVDATFDRIQETFAAVALPPEGVEDGSALVALGDAYRRLLQREPTVGMVMLQGYAAAADDAVRDVVSRRYLSLQREVTRLSGADALAVRSFFATGLVITVSTVLQLPGRRTDATWGAWLILRSAPADRHDV